MGCLKLPTRQLLLGGTQIQVHVLTYRERTQNSCHFRCVHCCYQSTHSPDDVDHVVIWGFRIVVVDCIDNDRRRKPNGLM